MKIYDCAGEGLEIEEIVHADPGGLSLVATPDELRRIDPIIETCAPE